MLFCPPELPAQNIVVFVNSRKIAAARSSSETAVAVNTITLADVSDSLDSLNRRGMRTQRNRRLTCRF
jgi:hypothetical protein